MMKFKIILVVLIITLEAVFAGLNMKNVSDISFGFTILKDVPVFFKYSYFHLSAEQLLYCLLHLFAKKRKINLFLEKKNLLQKKKA